MTLDKEDFKRVFELSDHPYACGITYLIESDNKIYSFCFGADGTIWNKTMGTAESTREELIAARRDNNYLGIYECRK